MLSLSAKHSQHLFWDDLFSHSCFVWFRRAYPHPGDSRNRQWTQAWPRKGLYPPGLSDCFRDGHIIWVRPQGNEYQELRITGGHFGGWPLQCGHWGRKTVRRQHGHSVQWSQFSVTSWLYSGWVDKWSSTSESWNSAVGFVIVEVIGVLSVGQYRWKLDWNGVKREEGMWE